MPNIIQLRIAGTEITHSLQLTEKTTAEEVLGMVGLSSSDYDLSPGIEHPPFAHGEPVLGRVKEGEKLIASAISDCC